MKGRISNASSCVKVNALMYGEADKFLFFNFLCTYFPQKMMPWKIFPVKNKME